MSTPLEYDGIKKLIETRKHGIANDYREHIDDKEVLHIKFQEGGTATTERNGVFIEDLLIAAYVKLDEYNKHLPSRENSLALTKIEESLQWLQTRKLDREARGVYGTESK